MLGAKQQDLRWEGALVTNTPFREPGRGAPAPCCRNCWTNRHRVGRILQPALGAHWEGKGGDGHPVPQRRWRGVAWAGAGNELTPQAGAHPGLKLLGQAAAAPL